MSTQIDTRQRILSAAEAIFSEKGFHLATMDEVAERAHVAKGTVFYNFGSKAAVFETVLRNGMEYLTGTIRAELSADRPPLEQIAAILELHVKILSASPGLIAIFSRELSNGLEDQVRRTIERTKREYVSFVAGLLDEARRYGIVRELDSAMLASTLFDLALSACSYAGEHPASAGQVSAFLRTLVLEGIAARRSP